MSLILSQVILNLKKRTATVANARRVVIYLARELTHNSMPDIAKFLGMKDHSSISHNIKKKPMS